MRRPLTRLKSEFTEFAFLEMEDAREYYNLQRENFGDTFKQDIKEAVDRITVFPHIYPIAMDNIRKCVMHRFPYNIFYTITKDTVLILSIANHHRKPYYWVGDER